MGRFFIVMDQRDEIDFSKRTQLPEQVIGADTIAPVWCVGQAVCEKQDPHRGRMTFPGTPAATTLSGMGEVTTAPAPTMELVPTSAMTIAPLPIHDPAPIRTRLRSPSWSRIGTSALPVP